jgi:hypothetical protein
MGTPTKHPKPKSGQSAGKNTNGKQGANRQNAGATQPLAKAAASDTESATRTATGAAPSAPKATTPPGAKGSTGAKDVTVVNKAAASTKPLAPKPQPNKREQKREQKREEISRKIEERRQQREREQRKRRVKKWTFIGVPAAALLVGLGILLYNLFFGPQVAPYLRGAPIDGINCDALEQTATHYHAHLQIYVNGQQVPIPGDVGRQSITQCYYWLHVHSDTGDEGVIHVESPDNRVYRLYQFFDIWGQPLSATNLLGHQVDAKHKLTVYVYDPTQQPTDSTQPFTVTPPNDLKPYTGDPRQIQIKPHELIVLEYGTPVVPPPAWTFLPSE